MLYQRRDESAVAALVKLAKTSDLPEGRMHALYALAGLDALHADVVLSVLSGADPRVRDHAVRLAEGVSRARTTTSCRCATNYCSSRRTKRIRTSFTNSSSA